MTTEAPDGRDGATLLAGRLTPRRSPSVRDVLFRAYLVALFGPLALALTGAVTDTVVQGSGADLPVGAAGVPWVLTAVTLAVAAALVGLLRTAVWHGPVVVGAADVAWLLSSPRPHAAVLRPRLINTLQRSALAGAVLGGLAGVVTADVVGSSAWLRGAAGLAAGAAVALLGQAAAWWVTGSRQRAQLILHATPPAAVVLVLATAAVTALPTLGWLVAWSGPWGWAALALAGPLPAAASGGALLTAMAVAATVWMMRSADLPPVEELARRAPAASGVSAALFFGDTDSARLVAREAVDALRGPPRLGLPAPRSPQLALVWRDATVALRSPGQLAAGLLLSATAGVGVTGGLSAIAAASAAESAAAAPTHSPAEAGLGPWLLAGGVIAAMLAAGRLLGPLRAALAWPFGNLLLPWTDRGLLQRHLLWPAATLAAGALLGVGLAAAAPLIGPAAFPGPLPTTPMLLAALALVTVSPGLVALTAAAALRAPPDPAEIAWRFADEIAALQESLLSALRATRPALVLIAPTAALVGAAATPAPTATATLGAVAVGGAAAGSALAWRWLCGRRMPWQPV